MVLTVAIMGLAILPWVILLLFRTFLLLFRTFFRIFTAIPCFSWFLPWLWQTSVIISPIRAYNSHPQCAGSCRNHEKSKKPYEKGIKWRYSEFFMTVSCSIVQFSCQRSVHICCYELCAMIWWQSKDCQTSRTTCIPFCFVQTALVSLHNSGAG